MDNTRNTSEVFRLNHIITTEIEIDNILASTPVFDIIVLDYKMPDKDGMEVAKEILIINPDQRIICFRVCYWYFKRSSEELNK